MLVSEKTNAHNLPIYVWPDGRSTQVLIMFGNRGRVVIGDTSDETGYADGWCYDTLRSAFIALAQWNPMEQTEPDGWVKHINTQRRRINGRADLEYTTFEEELKLRESLKEIA